MSAIRTRVTSRAVRAYRRARRTARARYTQAIAVTSRADLPETLHPRRIYLLGGTTLKWALLDCPCGRGHVIELNLANPTRTRWKVSTRSSGPSLHPSIDYQGETRCHYWLRDGRIDWVFGV